MYGVNMPHCRFHNTLRAMEECQAALETIAEEGGDWGDLSESEAYAAKKMLRLCREIDGEFGDLADDA